MQLAESADGSVASRAGTPHVSVVVLNHDGRGYTVECLRSLAAVTYPELSVVLIDNGCAEFEEAELASFVQRSRYVRTDVNLGFTGGVNLGIRQALAMGADHVFLLNNDTRIEPGAIAELVRVAQSDAKIGIVGAKMLQMDRPERIDSVGLDVDLRWGRVRQRGYGERDTGQYDAVADLPVVSGGAMLLSRALCRTVGGFDDRYYRYGEDVDMCLRAGGAGFRVVFAPHARVYHKGKGMAGGQTSPLILYYATRNHLLLLAEHADGGRGARLARNTLVLLLNAVYALREPAGSRLERLRAVVRAGTDYARGITGPVAG
jgi:GT2 family glycosyltransferase